jgi:hypothetical protein
MTLMRWFSSSLKGHVLFFEAILGLPATIYGIVSNSMEGTLTLPFVVEMVPEIAAITAVAAAAVWYAVTQPIIRGKPKK